MSQEIFIGSGVWKTLTVDSAFTVLSGVNRERVDIKKTIRHLESIRRGSFYNG